ncbi:hypothetical protein [Streptomyces sp. NPDC059611]|uniref:hypothetical protein n=1 Tax=Streptomyces sp. NPDC059611 TaxID=3346884 RepID=UPI0036A90F9D
MTACQGTALTLTHFFRFGPHIANEANRWLSIATAPLRFAGTETIPTTLGQVDQPDAVLCRTGVGAMHEVMQLLDTDHRVALTGGGESLRALARAADGLRAGRRTSPAPSCCSFPPGVTCKDYVPNDPTGRDLQPLVDLVGPHGTDATLNAVHRLDPESTAHVTVSTAHKSKGREWASVETADDFTPPHPATPTGKTPTGGLSPAPSTKRKHALATSLSLAPATSLT